jgi:hypothetical protein
MPVTGYSVRGDSDRASLPEPLPRIQSLLFSCVYYPLLVLEIDDFAGNCLEPV